MSPPAAPGRPAANSTSIVPRNKAAGREGASVPPVVSITRHMGTQFRGEVELPFQHIHLLGRHVGYLLDSGEIAMIRIVSEGDRKLIEVAAAMVTGKQVTAITEFGEIETNEQ